MGYSTDFSGEIAVSLPESGERGRQLPDEWVKRWNDATSGDPEHQYSSGGRSEPADYFPTDIEEVDRVLDDGRQWIRTKPVMLFGWPREIVLGVTQPQSWCQWELSNDTTVYDGEQPTWIRWDGGEKFYEYGDWLEYLVAAIKKDFPGARFDGEIEWRGEEWDDFGALAVQEDGTIDELPRAGALSSGYRYTDNDVESLARAAHRVVANWESGDLADAVRALDAIVQRFPLPVEAS